MTPIKMKPVDAVVVGSGVVGSIMYRSASLAIGGGTVALRSSVCRSFGQRRRIFSISGRKPISSMRSASSRTTTSSSSI